MSVTTTTAASSQSLTSAILQQLLSGSNAQATSGLSPTVLKEVLDSSGVSQTGSAATAPAAITQALGDLLQAIHPSSPLIRSGLITVKIHQGWLDWLDLPDFIARNVGRVRHRKSRRERDNRRVQPEHAQQIAISRTVAAALVQPPAVHPG